MRGFDESDEGLDSNDRPMSRRRALLKAAAAGALGGPLAFSQRAWSADASAVSVAGNNSPKALKLAWSATAICTVPVPVALKKGFFQKYNLDVSFVNFAGSTDQLLEAISSGKADGGVGMALRWLKPLEQGFDVKITTGIHGGCMRLLVPQGSAITNIAALKGRAIGVSDMASPSKNFFSILLAHQGIDPVKDVDWRTYPADLLGQALKKFQRVASLPVSSSCTTEPLCRVRFPCTASKCHL